MFKKNKKAQIGEITHDLVAFLAAFLLVAIFFLGSLFFVNSGNKTIQQRANILQDSVRINTVLISLLEKRTEIEIDNQVQEISFYDLILLSQIDEKYKANLKETEKKLEEFCRTTSKSYGCYFSISHECPKVKEKGTEYLACILIPSNKTLAVTMLNVYTFNI